jgi:hypothetical protein
MVTFLEFLLSILVASPDYESSSHGFIHMDQGLLNDVGMVQQLYHLLLADDVFAAEGV